MMYTTLNIRIRLHTFVYITYAEINETFTEIWTGDQNENVATYDVYMVDWLVSLICLVKTFQARSQNCEKRLLAPSCLSVRME